MFNLIPSVTLDEMLVLSKTVKSVYVQDKTLVITTDLTVKWNQKAISHLLNQYKRGKKAFD